MTSFTPAIKMFGASTDVLRLDYRLSPGVFKELLTPEILVRVCDRFKNCRGLITVLDLLLVLACLGDFSSSMTMRSLLVRGLNCLEVFGSIVDKIAWYSWLAW